ncbi:MAG: hypothetical protein ACLQU5_03065 [Isosphaeraceae bacterium]
MAKKKDELPATQSRSNASASPDKKAKHTAPPKPARKDSSPEESNPAEFEVILDTLDSKGFHLTGSLMRAYLNAFAVIGRGIAGISNTPQGKRLLGHRLEMQKKREQARNEQLLARAEIDRAIAKRIETAESVEIEETFDASAKGHAGVSKDEKGGQVGIGGEGQKIVRRKIVLRGTVTGDEKNNRVELSAIETSPATPSEGDKASPPQPSSDPIGDEQRGRS